MKLTKFQLFLSGVTVSLLTLTGAVGVYANVQKINAASSSSSEETNILAQDSPRREEPSKGEEGPPITTTSGPAEIALARHLKSLDAKFYGAYWCPYCHAQEQLLGKEAFAEINYIECDPRGKNAQTEVCMAANIKGFPTWEINNKFYSGLQSLDKLAEISGYQGDRNFQHSFPPRRGK
ncbi:glutaredoxin family protein [Microcoleus sp. FACHB-672]|uniref:glutaredoxin family protein n=1 Tax=Microcoleus sp. FACHB-672 TaxID=2692825 RepID=UPI001687D8BC|nr:hypothetical protein [Microcoleus sp. FACHB-672]MBD2042839.1 hypothetical protein [Microcoleus sp. FACHB-672]